MCVNQIINNREYICRKLFERNRPVQLVQDSWEAKYGVQKLVLYRWVWVSSYNLLWFKYSPLDLNEDEFCPVAAVHDRRFFERATRGPNSKDNLSGILVHILTVPYYNIDLHIPCILPVYRISNPASKRLDAVDVPAAEITQLSGNFVKCIRCYQRSVPLYPGQLICFELSMDGQKKGWTAEWTTRGGIICRSD